MNFDDFFKLFDEYAKSMNLTIDEDKIKKFYLYMQLLIEWNEKINLTAITEPKEVIIKHFIDSLSISGEIKDNSKIIDVGTGAGFPGIVLKIVYPNLKITLVDALQKRVNYLNAIIKDLQLENIQAIHTRGEDLHDKYDVVTARAVANIEKLLKYTMHLVNNTGVFVAMKGNIDNELTPEIENKISKKYQILKIEKFELPIENSQRSLIVIKSISS